MLNLSQMNRLSLESLGSNWMFLIDGGGAAMTI